MLTYFIVTISCSSQSQRFTKVKHDLSLLMVLGNVTSFCLATNELECSFGVWFHLRALVLQDYRKGCNMEKDISRTHRSSYSELFRILVMFLIVSHHYVVNSGLAVSTGRFMLHHYLQIHFFSRLWALGEKRESIASF